MDGPHVNLKLYKEIVHNRKNNMLHSLLHIGSCIAHNAHGCFKTGSEKTNLNLKQLRKAAFQVFHDTRSKRRIMEGLVAMYQQCIFYSSVLPALSFYFLILK